MSTTESSPMKSQPPQSWWFASTLVVAFLVWRFACLWWNPIRFDGGMGAFFEASALVGSNLVAAWMVLGDGIWWRRIVVSLWLLFGLMALQDLGVMANDGSSLQLHSLKLIIYRHVEGEAIASTFILSLTLRLLTSWRISRQEDQRAPRSAAALRIPLLNFFLLTAFVAVLAGIIRTAWFRDFLRNDTYEIHRTIFLFALAIGLSPFPAGIILRARLGWLSISLMVVSWGLLPILIRLVSFAFGWLVRDDDVIYQLATIVAGSAAVSAGSALILRKLGYRWQTWEPSTTS